MDFKLYIKQSSYYKKVLKDWRDYLESFQENLLSDEKSKFKIQELTDRKDLIECNGLEELAIFNEIKEIHTLIKKEREVYNSILKLIQEPSQSGLFASKTKTKKIRNEQFSKYFKKLLSINTEQTTRINLFITSLELLDAKNGELTPKASENIIIKKEEHNTDKNSLEKTTAKNTTIIKGEPSLQALKISPTTNNLTTETNPNEIIKEINSTTETIENTESTKVDDAKTEEENKNISEDFDYETEMKRILGL